MRVEDREVGALVFSFRTPRAFSPDERAYLEAVTALCAQALDRARLLVAERDARAATERQLDRMTFLARAGRLLEAPLSVEQRLRRFADLAVPAIADWCAVHLVRADHVEQVAVAHADPEKVAAVARMQERYPPDPDAPTGAIHVSRTGVPSFFAEVPDELIAASAVDDEHLALARSIGIRSVLIVPLLVRGHSLGALTLVQAESGRRFDETDLAFAEQLAGNAAFALDNARLYEQQRAIAETLQAALLPAALPVVPGLRMAARYRAQSDEGSGIQVGGDLYDVVATPEAGCWAFVMADVCGKGPRAAALTALIRYTLRAEIDHDLPPVAALHRLNRAMLHASAGTPARFATVVLGRLAVDPGGATATLASGGHPPALVRRGAGDGVRVEPVVAPGTLLGVYADIELVEVTVRLDRGDMMVLYTDGVTEARSVDGFYGADRLARLLASSTAVSADALADELLDDVVAFAGGPLRDDVAVLVLEATA
jgi:serine phosphatase RsbU (regulator of sigma subunit)